MSSELTQKIFDWGVTPEGSRLLNKSCLPIPSFMLFCEGLERQGELDHEAANSDFNGFILALIKRADSSRIAF